MNRYWDLGERDRAGMSAEDVEAFARVELMEKGVVHVEVPQVEEVEEVNLPTETFYSISAGGPTYGTTEFAFLFADKDQAHIFLELSPLQRVHDYRIGDNNFAAELREPTVTAVELPREQDIFNARSALERNREAVEHNRKRKDEYDVALKASKEATEGMWADWYACRTKADHFADIKKTLEEYREMAPDEETAVKFLLKAYNREDVQEMLDWFKVEEPFKLEDL